MDSDGHRNQWGHTKGWNGWPTFDENGRRITAQRPTTQTRVDKIIAVIDEALEEHGTVPGS